MGFPGDDCSTAVDVPLGAGQAYSLAGLNLAQATGGDTPVLCAPISATGWFRVIPARTGTLSVTTDGSSFDTVAAVLGGSCGNLQVLGCNDDIGGSPHNTGSKVDGIPVQRGVPVYVVIGSYGSGQGGGGALAGQISLAAAPDTLTLTTTQLSGCPRAEWRVTVSDASGPVTGLGTGDFALTADGRDVPVTSVEDLGGGAYTVVSYGVIGGTGGTHDLVLQVDSASGSGQVEGSVSEAGTACASAIASGETLVLPGAAHLAGTNGTNWRTDVFGSVTGGGYALVDATYLPAAGSSSTTPIHRVLAVPEGGGSFGDVAASLFGVDAGKGSVLVRWQSMGGGRLALTSRTYNLLGAGNTMGLPAGSTFGQEMPAVPVSGAIPAGGHAWITGLVQEDGVARTNVGFVATGPSGASVTLDFTGEDGSTILSKQVSLGGYGYQQLDQVMRTVAGGVPAASVKVSVAAGGDPVVAYASVVDGKPTADPVTLLPTSSPSAVWYVPAAAHVTGQADTNWRTDLALFNPGATAVDVTVDFLQEKRANTSPQQSDAIHLAAGESRRIVNVMPALFNLTGVKGALRVDATGGILVASRTYNLLLAGNAWGLEEGATFGQNVPPLTPSQTLVPGETGTIPGLVRSASFRSNLVLLNTSGVQAQVVVSAMAADGGELGAAHTETLLPYEYRQVNDVLTSLGVGGDVVDGTLRVEVVGSGSSATAFLSVVDERTGDPVSRTVQR